MRAWLVAAGGLMITGIATMCYGLFYCFNFNVAGAYILLLGAFIFYVGTRVWDSIEEIWTVEDDEDTCYCKHPIYPASGHRLHRNPVNYDV